MVNAPPRSKLDEELSEKYRVAIQKIIVCARYGEIEDVQAQVAAIEQELAEDSRVKNVVDVMSNLLAIPNASGNTALHCAAANGEQELVEYLLSKVSPAVVNAKNTSGNTPLHWAGLNGHENIVRLLIEKGGADGKLQNYQGRSVLFEVKQAGHDKLFEYLMTAVDWEADFTAGDDVDGAEDETLMSATDGDSGAQAVSLSS